MSSWYEVFDNVEVQHVTRKRVAKLMATVVGLVAATLTLLALGHQQVMPLAAAGVLVVVVWTAAVWCISRRMRRLRRVVWCVKLSDREVVGYDYTRHKVRLDWIEVARVDVTHDGLVVYGPDPVVLEVPKLFPDFPALSHRVVGYADFYGVPVYLEGRPWDQLDVFALFPGLADVTSSPASRGPAAP